jgi:hypothetical protein
MLDGLESGKDIAKRVDRLLKKADAYGRFPTPVEDIVEAAKLTSEDDYSLDESIIAKLPASLRKVFRTGVNKIQGLADRRERVIHVAPEVTVAGRRRCSCRSLGAVRGVDPSSISTLHGVPPGGPCGPSAQPHPDRKRP